MNEESNETGVVLVTFPELSAAEANQAAQELRQDLLERTDDIHVELHKEAQDTQDLGSTIVLFFGTGGAIAIAHGIASYLAKRGSRVHIRTKDGEIIATGDAATNIDVAKTAAALKRITR